MTEQELTPNAGVPFPSNLLDADERAIWWDKPDPYCYARQQAGRAVFAGLFFAAIGSFMIVKAIEARSDFAVLFCACFVVIGLYIASEPLRRYIEARHIVYLLTDKRAIVAQSRVVKSVVLAMIKSVDVTQTSKAFADVLYFDRVLQNSESGHEFVRDGFIGIANADAVAREMRRLQAVAS